MFIMGFYLHFFKDSLHLSSPFTSMIAVAVVFAVFLKPGAADSGGAWWVFRCSQDHLGLRVRALDLGFNV